MSGLHICDKLESVHLRNGVWSQEQATPRPRACRERMMLLRRASLVIQGIMYVTVFLQLYESRVVPFSGSHFPLYGSKSGPETIKKDA